ncbi:peptidylprolyl isomerase [Sneathiella aquimaris]|uniref:peptidylprolyl isomerase n=1 Tax=Sneathiella aquimaris TaxID=2599305 RepID=UPI00146BE085|nr:peptidylprolyl isomerase [Sneathiella aquimaris]
MITLRTLIGSLIVAAFLSLNAMAVKAQEVQKIVAVVNDEVISGYDLVQRISLTILMSGIRDSRKARQELVNPTLRRLIDERLKLQEAARYNLTVTDLEMNQAVDRLEKQNNIPSGQLDTILANRNISIDTLLEQIRGQLAWDKVIRRRISPRVRVTDEEIEAAQKKMRENKGKNEYLISEIYVPVERQTDEPKIRELLGQLREQMKSGTPFPRIASQFSQGPTAAKGGDIGWTMAEDLPPEVAAEVGSIKKGRVSSAIRTSDGYYMIAVRDIRQILGDTTSNATLELSQLVIPLTPAKKTGQENSQVKLINSLSKFIDSCNYVPAMLSEIATTESGKMGRVQLKNLPEKFRNLVKDLEPGQASAPFLDKDKYRIFIVCDRRDQNSQGDSEDAIRQMIGVKRIEARARRYLKDLQQEATIETR